MSLSFQDTFDHYIPFNTYLLAPSKYDAMGAFRIGNPLAHFAC